jgi:hypothetical protein
MEIPSVTVTSLTGNSKAEARAQTERRERMPAKRTNVSKGLGKCGRKLGCPAHVPQMSRTCPVSYKERDIYGACMAHVRGIPGFGHACPGLQVAFWQVLGRFQVRMWGKQRTQLSGGNGGVWRR